jgi:hypothetical protein
VLVALTVAEVSLGLSRVEMSTMSRSRPDMLFGLPFSCGRSPATVTAVPRVLRVELKKLLAGFCASESTVPLKEMLSPVSEPSPS